MVSLPDRDDLQLAAGVETGEYNVDDGMAEHPAVSLAPDTPLPASESPAPVVQVEFEDEVTDPSVAAAAPVQLELDDTPIPLAARAPSSGMSANLRWALVAGAVLLLGVGATVIGVAAWFLLTLS